MKTRGTTLWPAVCNKRAGAAIDLARVRANVGAAVLYPKFDSPPDYLYLFARGLAASCELSQPSAAKIISCYRITQQRLEERSRPSG